MTTPQIVNTIDILMSFIPNKISVVDDEINLFDKILPNIILAERWLFDTILDFNTYSKSPLKTEFQYLVSNLVACVAFKSAMPSLDLVLTPNGFGVVSSSAIAPASKDRVAKYIASLENDRDALISSIVKILQKCPLWQISDLGKWFASTLFCTTDLTEMLGITNNCWSNYLGLRTRVIYIESLIADAYISHEYMQELRNINFLNTIDNTIHLQVITRLKSAIVVLIKSQAQDLNSIKSYLEETVNFIRTYPEEFQTWHSSQVAKYYIANPFINKSDANAYFF